MGARGPKPGQYRVQMMPAGSPVASKGTRYKPGAPDRPKHLGKAARKVWDRTVKEMSAAGALVVADRDVLAVYCVAVADFEAISAEIERDGPMIDSPTFDRNGKPTGATVRKPHPGLKWRSDLMNKVRQYAETLGLTPAARSRAGASPEAAPTAATNKVIALRDRIAALREAN